MYLPSKILISEVLVDNRVKPENITLYNDKVEIKYHCSINQKEGTNYNKNDINDYYVIEQDLYEYINVFKLANLCKEWAFKRGCILSSYINYENKEDNNTLKYDCTVKILKNKNYIHYIKEDNNEYEAIFKACEWILLNNFKI